MVQRAFPGSDTGRRDAGAAGGGNGGDAGLRRPIDDGISQRNEIGADAWWRKPMEQYAANGHGDAAANSVLAAAYGHPSATTADGASDDSRNRIFPTAAISGKAFFLLHFSNFSLSTSIYFLLSTISISYYLQYLCLSKVRQFNF